MGRPDWWKTACAVCVLYAATAITARAQTFTSLYSFDSTGGANPVAGLVQATNGDLYGTTGTDGTYSGGTAFKITTGGALTRLYNFCSQSNCADGSHPIGGLIQGSDGDFYGTTYEGGTYSLGTVFKMTTDGALTTLLSFNDTNGDGPFGLIRGTDGNFYGTTELGGAYNHGTVFKITREGTLTTLHSFCERYPCTGGAYPSAGLVQATNGNFYGTTSEGGGGNGCQEYPPEGCGTVFKITPRGNLTILYSFCGASGCPDGGGSFGALLQASDGNFYGASPMGGANGYGTVFKMTGKGALSTLYSFCSQSNCADGANPHAALVQGTDGNLYGTTELGGTYYNSLLQTGGTIFKITLEGALTTLYSFCSQSGCPDGSQPIGSLVEDTNGTLYGTTSGGGVNDTCGLPGCGTVFSLSADLDPFVETNPTSGRVGTSLGILGTNLTGATSVTFNGTAARFTVVSSSLITTTVPSGATTGKIRVVTPSGTLSSNIAFRVTQ